MRVAESHNVFITRLLFSHIVGWAFFILTGCQPQHKPTTPVIHAPGAVKEISYQDTFQKRGLYHTVKKGETVYQIGRMYNSDPAAITRMNKLPSSGAIEVGQRLFIPASRDRAPVVSTKPVRSTKQLRFVPPLRGSHQLKDDVLYITADAGTNDVCAIEQGTVTFSGFLKGYGQTIIIEHGQGFSSVYSNLMKTGKVVHTNVLKGECIGQVESAALQFQLRREGRVINPFTYIKQ